MRQKRNDDSGEQDMVAVGAMARAAMPGVEPPARGERAKDMFVGTPGEDLRNLFDFRTGMIRNPLRDFDVGPGWPYPKRRHRRPLARPDKNSPATSVQRISPRGFSAELEFDVAG